jgi:AcrR family transcriptional regulator
MPQSKPRADAQKNRKAVLDAAAEVFAESGMDAAVERIAERGGVGVGTVYRHFPSKDALIEAVVAHRLAGLAEMMSGDLSLSAGDVSRFVGQLAREYVLKHMMVDYLAQEEEVLDLRGLPEMAQFLEALDKVVADAHANGVLRADVSAADLLAVIVAAAQSPRGERLITLMVEGLLPPKSAPDRT